MAIPAIPAQGAPWLTYAQALDDEIRTGRLSDAELRAASVAAVESRTSYAAVNDRVIWAPGGALTFGWTFLPLVEPGTHYGAAIVRESGFYKLYSLFAEGELGLVHQRDPIYSIAGDSVYDPSLLVLPTTKNFFLGFHSGSEGKVYIYRSTDSGASWVQRKVFDAGDPFVTHRRFSEVHLIRANLGNTYAGTVSRIIAAWCDIDPVLPPSRDTVMVTAYSDDEGATWSTPVVVTPTSGANSAGILNDNTRPWIYMDDAGQVNMLFSRVQVTGGVAVGSIWHTVLNGVGATVVAAPVKVSDTTYATSLSGGTEQHPGMSPAVFVGRDGKYHLVWTEANYAIGGSDGAMYAMSGDGTPGGWQNKTTLIHRTDAPNGFGRVQPLRVGRDVELLYGWVNTPTSSQLRSLTLAGL